MQETFEAQRESFVYPKILNLEAQKERLKCTHKQQAYSVCIDKNCQIAGLMCMDLSCQCRKIHFKCHHIQLQRVLQSINNHQKQVPEEVKKSYKQVRQFINGMIEQLLQTRINLDLEQKYFGLAKKELNFMALIDQKKIEKICGKLVSELQMTFQNKSNFVFDKAEQILNDFKSKRKQFESLVKYINENYTKYKSNEIKQSNKEIRQLLFDSKIVRQSNEKEMIHKWLSEVFINKKIKSKLLFRASQHNFQAAQFHKYCDGIENTLVIVKNQYNKVFGGFTPKIWKTVNQEKCHFVNDQTEKSFIYSVSLRQNYSCIDPQKSIVYHKNVGPAFGGGCDFVLKDVCNNNRNSFAAFASSYNLKINGKNKYHKNQQTYTLFSGSPSGKTFKVEQYEVYQIIQI